MKRFAIAAVAVACFGFAGGASAACPPAPGDNPVMAVSADKSIRVMAVRLRPDMSFIEICTRDTPSADWRMQFSEYVRPNWYFVWTTHPQSAAYELSIFSDRTLTNYTHQAWAGMRRASTSTGFTLSFYDAAGPDNPNTIVEVCIYTSIYECPNH